MINNAPVIGSALLGQVAEARANLLADSGSWPKAAPPASETRVCVRVRPVSGDESTLLGELIPGRSDKSFAQVEYDAVVVPPRGADGMAPSHLFVLSDEKHLGVATGGIASHAFKAHAVYDADAGEAELGAGELAALVECAAAGGDATLLAYGSTGAGKTFSCVALQAAAALALLRQQQQHPGMGEAAAEVILSFYELAGDKIRDLLPQNNGSTQEASGGASDALHSSVHSSVVPPAEAEEVNNRFSTDDAAGEAFEGTAFVHSSVQTSVHSAARHPQLREAADGQVVPAV